MRTGTVVNASRKQIGILVLFDGDENPTAFRHDDVINGADDTTDLLDGKGVRVGMRVEETREPNGIKLRLTGEVFAADPDDDPAPARGLDTPEKFLGWAKSLPPAGRLDAWMTAIGGAPMPFDPDDLDELLDK